MSFVTSFKKHFSLNEMESKRVFLNTVTFIQLNKLKIENKGLVKFLRNCLKEDHSLDIPQQKMYDILSQIMGFKNYNVALSKQVDFKNIFISDPLFKDNAGRYDLSFQQNCIRLSLIDDQFCSQIVKYLGDSEDLNIFEHKDLSVLFKMIVETFKQYQKKPSKTQLRQIIMRKNEKDRRSLTHALKEVFKTNIDDEKNFRDQLTGFIKQGVFLKDYSELKKIWGKYDADQTYVFLKGMINEIESVNFEKDSDFITPTS